MIAGALVAVEFVSTDALNRWSALAQVLVVGVKVNSGELLVVDSLYSRKREKPPTLTDRTFQSRGADLLL
jgi:hypothetical protein